MYFLFKQPTTSNQQPATSNSSTHSISKDKPPTKMEVIKLKPATLEDIEAAFKDDTDAAKLLWCLRSLSDNYVKQAIMEVIMQCCVNMPHVPLPRLKLEPDGGCSLELSAGVKVHISACGSTMEIVSINRMAAPYHSPSRVGMEVRDACIHAEQIRKELLPEEKSKYHATASMKAAYQAWRRAHVGEFEGQYVVFIEGLATPKLGPLPRKEDVLGAILSNAFGSNGCYMAQIGVDDEW